MVGLQISSYHYRQNHRVQILLINLKVIRKHCQDSMSERQARVWEHPQELEVLPVGPRARICPTARPGSQEEKIQVNIF